MLLGTARIKKSSSLANAMGGEIDCREDKAGIEVSEEVFVVFDEIDEHAVVFNFVFFVFGVDGVNISLFLQSPSTILDNIDEIPRFLAADNFRAYVFMDSWLLCPLTRII